MKKQSSQFAANTLVLCLAIGAASTYAQSGPAISTTGGQDFQNRVEFAESGKVGPQYLYMYGMNAKWTTGVYQWFFNPANVPASISQDGVLAAMKTAAARWEQMCNITIQYMGTTAVLGNQNVPYAPDDGVNVWGFQPLAASINQFSGWTPVVSSSDGTIRGADIILNSNMPWTLDVVEATMTHEIGHGIGLAHSNVASAIMFANPYHDAQYIRTLRGDDAQGCASLYGASPMAMVNRTMNWAESAYSSLLKSGPAPNGSYQGYLYRYYPQSNNYTGYKDGNAYFMGPDGNIQNLGPMSGYTDQVTAAGF